MNYSGTSLIRPCVGLTWRDLIHELAAVKKIKAIRCWPKPSKIGFI